MSAADFYSRDINDRILWMKGAVGKFIWFLNVHDLVDGRINLEKLRIHLGGVSDTADDGHLGTDNNVGVQSFSLDHLFNTGNIILLCTWF